MLAVGPRCKDLRRCASDFPVCSSLMSQAVLANRKVFVSDGANGGLFGFAHSAADSVERVIGRGQRPFVGVIGVEQERVSAVLCKSEMPGVSAIVANIAFVIVHTDPKSWP